MPAPKAKAQQAAKDPKDAKEVKEVAEGAEDAGSALSQQYESVFCIFMILLAFLFRDNPYLVYPQILYLLVVLLGLNLFAGMAARRGRFGLNLAAAAILANCGTIAAILAYSGEQASNLWVLFLLPIYSACVLLEGREAVWITLGAIGCNVLYYFFSTPFWDVSTYFELSMKSAVLAAGGLATWRVVLQERESTRLLKDRSAELERSANYLKLFHRLIAQIDDAILVIRPDTGHLVDINGSWCRALGYPRELFKVIGINDVAGSLPGDMHWREFVDQIRERKVVRYECSPKKKDGSVLMMEMHAQWVSQDGKDYVVAVARQLPDGHRPEAVPQPRERNGRDEPSNGSPAAA